MTSTKFIVGIEFTRNYVGFLKPHMKEAIYAYIQCPTNDAWNDIYAMVINVGKINTVWQAVLAIDPSFPSKLTAEAYDEDNVQWSVIPEPAMLIRAINHAVFVERLKKQMN